MKFYKKGMVVPELLGIVLAIIGLIAIGFLGIKLYSMFVNTDLKNAKAFVEDLTAKIENLPDGQSNTFAMRGVKEWVLVGYNLSDQARPEKCFLNSCLCMCKDSLTNCQEIGYCRAIDRNVSVSSVGTINFDLVANDAQPNFYSNISGSCYYSFQPLDPVLVRKSKEEIKITVDYGKVESDDIYLSLDNQLKLCKDYRGASERTAFRISGV